MWRCAIIAKVVRVVDGDTIIVKCLWVKQKVRLWVVDAPESDQLFGVEATNYLAKILGNKIVWVSNEGDSYDRIVGSVSLLFRGDIAKIMLKKGLCHIDDRFIFETKNVKKNAKIKEYLRLNKQAIDKRKGLYAYPYIHPREWREKIWEVRTPIEPIKVTKQGKKRTIATSEEGRVVINPLAHIRSVKNSLFGIITVLIGECTHKKVSIIDTIEDVYEDKIEAYRIEHRRKYESNSEYRESFDCMFLVELLDNTVKDMIESGRF